MAFRTGSLQAVTVTDGISLEVGVIVTEVLVSIMFLKESVVDMVIILLGFVLPGFAIPDIS